MEQITFEKYEDLEITTQTWVVYTNLQIDNQVLFGAIECKMLRVPIARSQQRMIVNPEENHLVDGDILFVEYLGAFKGQHFRKRKANQMRNCATLIMKVGDKYYNIKVSKKGNLQITGCRSEYPVKKIVEYLWALLLSTPNSYFLQKTFSLPTFMGYACCRMHNVRFVLPYKIDLNKLNNTVKTYVGKCDPTNGEVEYSSTYEPSIGYGGVNVKISSSIEKVENISVIKFCVKEDNSIEFTEGKFKEYLATLDEKERAKKTSKGCQNSFLIFHSGRAIMSGKFSDTNRRDSYEKFCSMVHKYKQYFCIVE